MLHGAVVRSDVAHARINSIDTRAAEKLAGVRITRLPCSPPNILADIDTANREIS